MNNPEASLAKMDSAFDMAVKRMDGFIAFLIEKYGYHFPRYRGWRKLSRRRGTPWYRHRDAWRAELYRMAYWQPDMADPNLTWAMFKDCATAFAVGLATMRGVEVAEYIRSEACVSYRKKLAYRNERAKCST